MATINNLPAEIIEPILAELDHITDRIAAHCVCRMWRHGLTRVRRYAWMLNKPENFLEIAVRALEDGRWPVIQWLLDGRDELLLGADRLLLAATRARNLDAVGWLRGRGCKWTPDSAAKAIAEGHENVVDQAHDDGHLCHIDVLCALAQTDNVDSLQSAIDRSQSVSHRVIYSALVSGSVSVLRWAYGRDASWVHSGARKIVLDGHARAVAWAATEAGIAGHWQWTRWIYEALHRNRLDMVMWFYDRDAARRRNGDSVVGLAPDTLEILFRAIREGRIDIAADLIDDPIVQSRITGDDMRHRGTLWCGCADQADDQKLAIRVLGTLMDVGLVQVTDLAYRDAARKNQATLLAWLGARARPDAPGAQLAVWCLESGNADVVEWVLSTGEPLPADPIRRAIRPCPHDGPHVDRHTVACMLTDHGCTWSAGACEDAARWGMLSTLALAVDRVQGEWDPGNCLRAALSNDGPRHRRTARWIANRAGIDIIAFERNLVRSAATAGCE
ncbi:F-box domain containing protein [Pandoravirus neocaledonia]|uniref:F-box domain containing protein n=1 Tax=Pandoravirus neocaledonia TaxID=2107708 RepID=A0A2U7UDV0_9VIRU|nr:F-box domain containing protein [Pandoravirus neocaledonia]AVK76613.1 F-box domain containing protein [Pandoravirus neocaledonia]